MAGEPEIMPPLEHIGEEGSRNEQAVRGTGAGGRLIQSGSPHRGDKAGGWNYGGSFNCLVGALRELSGESIHYSITRSRAIGQSEIKAVEKQ